MVKQMIKKLVNKYYGAIFFYITVFVMTLLVCNFGNFNQTKSATESELQIAQNEILK